MQYKLLLYSLVDLIELGLLNLKKFALRNQHSNTPFEYMSICYLYYSETYGNNIAQMYYTLLCLYLSLV